MITSTRLSETQIKDRAKHPKKAATLQRAIDHEDRIAFHTDLALSRDRVSPGTLRRYLSFVESLLPPDKFRLWLSVFRYPVKTVQITDNIFDDLKKVCDGQNQVMEVEFVDSKLASAFSDYDADEMWEERAFQTMKLAINSMVVVDMPTTQEGEIPEAYSYYLNIRKVIDYDDDHGAIQWAIFRIDETHYIYIDDVSYQTYQHEKGHEDKAVIVPERSTTHDLTYCPVTWFWSEPSSPMDPDIKRSPLTSHLEELDYLLFLLVSKNVTDLTASYPMSWAFEEECDYKREDLDKGIYVRCDHGLLRDQKAQWIWDADGNIGRCPVCWANRLTGPGTHITLPMPKGIENDVVIKQPAGYIGTDVKTLEYLVSEIERRTLNLHKSITGYDRTAATKEAINEKQITSEYEQRTAVLRELKKPFERIRRWECETKARLMYADKFISCHYDMGTDFYLYDSAKLLEMYNEARAKEVDTNILDFLHDQYNQTEFKNNPAALLEYEILKNILPYRHMPVSKLISLSVPGENGEEGIVTKKEIKVILNFPIFVSKFKREQGPLTEFGKNLQWDKRIEAIQNIIYSYANI